MIPFHIVCGFVGAFVLCPIAVFSHKGGVTHRRVGKWFLLDVIIISVSGALLLVDPLFLLIYWPQQSLTHDFAEYFKSAHYPELFFFYLNVTLIYFSFSAARVWERIGYGGAKTLSSNWIDWCLTLVAGIFVIGFLLIGIFDLIHADKLALEFIIGGLLVFIFVVFDLYTLILQTKVSGFPWWILHMTKMFVAWAALVSAFWLRIRVYVLPEDYIDVHYHTGTILWLSFTLIGYLVYRKRFQP